MISNPQETIGRTTPAGPAPAWDALLRRLDEPIRVLELRRYRRLLSLGRLPFVYAAAVLLLSWLLVPFFFAEGGVIAGGDPVSRYPGWAAGVLLAMSGLAAALGGYFRSTSLWWQERRLKTFHHWLLT